MEVEGLKHRGNLEFGNAKYQEALDAYEAALELTALITRERPDIGMFWISGHIMHLVS